MDKLEIKETKNDEIMHDFKGGKASSSPLKLIGLLLIVVLLGIGSGYFLAHKTQRSLTNPGKPLLGGNVQVGKTYGDGDTSTFSDIAEGTMKSGGIDGEGQYHLVRPGGDSQNVYLTSSQVDLSQFIDHKVKVWGQTQKAQHAGWLMDVGRVQVED